MTPFISIIVPSFNDGATIERCVLSLQAQDWPNFEILAIDDGSTDDTLQKLEKLGQSVPRLRVLRLERRGGAARARNVGFREARGEIVALIDGDMWAPPEWIPTIVAPLIAGAAEVTGGPDFVPPTAALVSRCIGYSMDSILTNAGLRMGNSNLVKYLPSTANMAILKSCLRRTGEFDETFHDYGEDKEWLHRIRDDGARLLYLAGAPTWHERRPDLALHFKKQVLSGRRRLDIFLKHPSSFDWPHFAPAGLVLFLTLAPLFPSSRFLWALCVAVGSALVLLDAARGALRLRDWRAFPVLLLSSPCIPLGYGLGVLVRACTLLARKALL